MTSAQQHPAPPLLGRQGRLRQSARISGWLESQPALGRSVRQRQTTLAVSSVSHTGHGTCSCSAAVCSSGYSGVRGKALYAVPKLEPDACNALLRPQISCAIGIQADADAAARQRQHCPRVFCRQRRRAAGGGAADTNDELSCQRRRQQDCWRPWCATNRQWQRLLPAGEAVRRGAPT